VQAQSSSEGGTRVLQAYDLTAFDILIDARRGGLDDVQIGYKLGTPQGNEFERKRILTESLEKISAQAEASSERLAIVISYKDYNRLVSEYDFNSGYFNICFPNYYQIAVQNDGYDRPDFEIHVDMRAAWFAEAASRGFGCAWGNDKDILMGFKTSSIIGAFVLPIEVKDLEVAEKMANLASGNAMFTTATCVIDWSNKNRTECVPTEFSLVYSKSNGEEIEFFRASIDGGAWSYSLNEDQIMQQ
jgi:hypothetical protein